MEAAKDDAAALRQVRGAAPFPHSAPPSPTGSHPTWAGLQVAIAFGADLSRKLLEAGAPGLHFYTLNLEKVTLGIMDELGLLKDRSVLEHSE
jgi:hypothetical protein